MKDLGSVKNNHLFLALALACLFVISSPRIASSVCKCTPPDLNSSIDSSDFIFIGNVLETSRETGNMLIKIQPTNIWKGEGDGPLTIIVSVDSECNVNFEKNKGYLVFAKGTKGSSLKMDQCSRTSNISKAMTDIAMLNNKFTGQK